MEDRITFILERFLKETKYVCETLKSMLSVHMQFTVRLTLLLFIYFQKEVTSFSQTLSTRKMQCSPMGMDHVISELCYKGTILQRYYRNMTILWSFSYNSFVRFHGKKFGSHNMFEAHRVGLCYK